MYKTSEPGEQDGFWRGFSTTEHLYTLNQVIQKTKEYKGTVYIAFVDLERLPTLEHYCLWTRLESEGGGNK